VSSALQAEISEESFHSVLEQLRAFQEDRYLHQTNIRQSDRILSYDDLPQAINDINSGTKGTLRCHFHLPIFIESVGSLQTTNYEIADCLRSIYKLSDCRHFEVETYAWTVLPEGLKTSDLARGISKELLWIQNQLDNINTTDRVIGEKVGLRT